MKISTRRKSFPVHNPEARRGERGFLVIAMMAIVAIMLLYLNINLRQLGNLRRELKGVEQQQIKRLEKIGAEPSPLAGAVTKTLTR